MKRQLMHKLKAWQQASDRKPLLLLGARQVGKTTLLHLFAEACYENVVSINFDAAPALKQLFTQDLQPERILRDLRLELNVEIKPGATLLIFDEIQECPEALNSLKYFNENANEYHVCGAGSLLGVRLAHTKGFPVGKVHFATLYPLNFIEFLDALGQSQLSDYLTHVRLTESINPLIHDKLIGYLREYLFVGGMPEAIKKYCDTKDFAATRAIHQDILQAYDLDFTKHAPEHLIMRIIECFRSLPSQLAKENKKFNYNLIKPGARARSHEEALQWLVEAGLIHKVINISTPKIPLIAYEKINIFKVYLVDVGLLNTLAGLTPKTILQGNQLFQEFSGALTENFVTQELIQHYQTLHYWTSDGQAEVDFVLQFDENLYPIEVKSGNSAHKKSLKTYQSKFQPKISIRLSPQNLDQQPQFINCPLYLTGQLPQLNPNPEPL